MQSGSHSITTSAQNRAELDTWFITSKYSDIKYWLSPNMLSSQEECEAQVLNTVRELDKLDSEGKNGARFVPLSSLSI